MGHVPAGPPRIPTFQKVMAEQRRMIDAQEDRREALEREARLRSIQIMTEMKDGLRKSIEGFEKQCSTESTPVTAVPRSIPACEVRVKHEVKQLQHQIEKQKSMLERTKDFIFRKVILKNPEGHTRGHKYHKHERG